LERCRIDAEEQIALLDHLTFFEPADSSGPSTCDLITTMELASTVPSVFAVTGTSPTCAVAIRTGGEANPPPRPARPPPPAPACCVPETTDVSCLIAS
jgi:hypothetical protein